MEEGYTHITVILDRTGSMASITDDVIGGFNAFLDQHRNGPGRATITLVQFDSQDPFEVLYTCRDIREAPYLDKRTYVPRAATPLLDAMGRGMVELDRALSECDEATRPETVLFVVITDGLENASREYSRSDIIRMIDERKQKGWQFVFLSADLDAIAEAGDLGVAYAQSLAFDRSAAGVRRAFHALSHRAFVSRACRAPLEFTEEDREQQEAERERTKREKKRSR